mgnify:CR=1 FL=1
MGSFWDVDKITEKIEIFHENFKSLQTNQLDFMSEHSITANDLLSGYKGNSTEECLRLNIRISLKYIESWIGGVGCASIYGLMEDAATAELSLIHI